MAETFDIESLTWGELAMVEEASGKTGAVLMKSSAYRQGLVQMVLASRRGEPVPSWSSLMSRKVLGGLSSPSPSDQDSPSPKSPDSA